MEIKQLTYFMAVAQAGSYSRAAELLGVAQPTISLSLKKLEMELGVELFYSFNRTQHLTDAGQMLKSGAEELLETYQRTLESVQSEDRETSGSFTFGLSPLFGDCFFGDIIPTFTKAYPNIKISMIECGAYKMDEMLAQGQVDLAVTLRTDRSSTFEFCHFTTQRNVALLHESHPLVHADSLTVADLKDDAFAIFNQDFILNRMIVSACHQAGFRPTFALLSSQWDFMVELVSKNHAVSILPKPVLDKHPAPQVCCVPMADSTKYWDIILAWHPTKYMPHVCRLFLNYVQKHLPPDDL